MDRPRRPGRNELIAVAAIVALGALLRLRGLEHAQFGRDAAHMLEMADVLLGGEMVLVGIPTSKGVRNPPLAIYVLAALRVVAGSPWAITVATALLNVLAVAMSWWVARVRFGERVAIVTALLFAVSGWAVLYSRAIWQQDFIPPLSVAALGALFAWTADRKPWALAWALALAGAVGQLHLTGLAWFAVIALLAVALRPPVKAAPVAAGIGACALMWAPFLIAMARGETAGPAGKKGPQALFVDFVGTAVKEALGSATHAGMRFEFPTIAEEMGRRLPGVVVLLIALAPWIAAALVIAGLAAILPRRDRVSLPRLRVDHDPVKVTLAAWVLVPVAAMVAVGLSTQPHYHIITFPAVWLLAALGAERLRPGPRAGAIAFVALMEIMHTVALQRWIAEDPPRPTLKNQSEAMRWMAKDAAGATPVLIAVPEPGAGTAQPPDAWKYLLKEELGRAPREGSTTYLVVDEGDGGLSHEASAALTAKGAKRFGPLWVARWE